MSRVAGVGIEGAFGPTRVVASSKSYSVKGFATSENVAKKGSLFSNTDGSPLNNAPVPRFFYWPRGSLTPLQLPYHRAFLRALSSLFSPLSLKSSIHKPAAHSPQLGSLAIGVHSSQRLRQVTG